MICYRCGCTLSEKDFCTGCGADVGMYKKILALSNRYYNDALEKCGVRDLSGAIVSLNQSIRLNKNNVDARNLLGLVYYEIGEGVEALGQWVISKNIRDTKNIATDYIDMIQEHPTRMDTMNQNLKKFNQALALCYQDSLDYATIQLKKILSVEPKYLKAHQLLALIYIRNEEWEKAEHEIERCMAIDANNTITMRYKQEVDAMLEPTDNTKFKTRKKDDEIKVQRYQSDNETIIQPINRKESKVGAILINMLLGIAIGIAVGYFLILPAKIYNINEEANEKITIVSDEKDKKTAELDAIGLQLNKLKAENDQLKQDIEKFTDENGSVMASDALMQAVKLYMENPENTSEVAAQLELLEPVEGVEEEPKSEAFNALYDKFMETEAPVLASYYYGLGYDSYKNEDFEGAIPNLKRAYDYDTTNVEALFYLGNSYRRTENEDMAKQIYAEVIDLFPGTERANKAETYLAEINNQE